MKKEAISSENFELANKIKDEQNSRKSIDDKLKEKNEDLKIALANENYEKAASLKKEIKELEEVQVKIKDLEEKKQIAIFQEKFDEVAVIEKQIKDLNSVGKSTQIQVPENNTVSTTTSSPQTLHPKKNGGKPTQIPVSENNTISNTPTTVSTPQTFNPKGVLEMMNNHQAKKDMATDGKAIEIIFPSGDITPNDDGVNDFLIFKNIEQYPKNELYILKAVGSSKIQYQTTNYQNNWGGESLDAGRYVYALFIYDAKNKKKTYKGAFELIR